MSVITAPAAPTHDLGGIRFTSLATPSRGSAETAVWVVEIDPGAPSTPHSLSREEVFVVLAGEAAIRLDGHPSTASAGDAIVVPADVPFSITNESSSVLRMVCCLPVGGQAVTDEGTFTPPWAA